MNLSTPVEEIPRVGPAFQKKLKKLGVKTIGQLLYHFPHRYEDFSNLIPIAKAEAGGPFCFQGEILDIRNIRTFRRRMILTQATIGDETGKLKALWFNQPYLVNNFKKGEYVCLAGKINGKGSAKYLSSPAYEKICSSPDVEQSMSGVDLTHTGRLIPVYPETEGLSSRWLRFIVKPILTKLENLALDPLPESIRNKYDFPPFQKAIWQIHFPDSLKLAEIAKRRFAFEELFILSLFVLRERMKLAKEKTIAIPLNLALVKEFIKTLPFQLTDAQKKSSWQILKDMEKPRPMNRLLEGDVGSGKTVVAAMAVLNTAKAGYQTAIMAPTEILAKQHHETMNNLLGRFNLKIGLITGKESYLAGNRIKRKGLLEKVRDGQVNILIGTHAIIQDTNPKTKHRTPTRRASALLHSSLRSGVQFNNLAFVVIDEQHRFGVEQRAKLLKPDVKGLTSGFRPRMMPHFLSMTATPIPRTLALTVYGDLDLSIINELPEGRKKVITKIIQPKDKKEIYGFIRKEVKEGRQVFVICPRIEPAKISQENLGGQAPLADELRSSSRRRDGRKNLFLRPSPLFATARVLDKRGLSWLEVKAAKEEYEKLSREIFPDLKVGLLHGKMKTKEKEKAMEDFKNRKIDILVSTSVVEVGVDIPNASIMLIEGSEKFGLAQLHQFRGRIGRGKAQSFCFLFTDATGKLINRRLRALLSCENGFELAEKDLAIRGPGAVDGIRQWGIPDLSMASLTDALLIEKVRKEAGEILQQDPQLKKYPLLKKRLEEFRTRIHFE